MDDKTIINHQLKLSMPTIVNQELEKERAHLNAVRNELRAGTIIQGNEIYTVQKKMDTLSSEADLYLCRNQKGQLVVAKVYKRENPLKQGVLEALKRIQSPCVAKIYDGFIWENHTIVVMQYFKNGSLSGKRFSFEEMKQYIIPDINEGLRSIHSANLIHKDLKPANIMLCDNGKDVAIIDFGISSLLEDGNTVLLTKTGMTPVYSAPEIFNGLALAEADYYSFGITLYELFYGKTPYAGLSDEEIARFTKIQRIPLPQSMPDKLRKLISALTYPDITNRTNKSNPNRRWVYPEVQAWLRDEPLPSPGGFDTAEMNPFTFQGKIYTKIPDLIAAMGLNWDSGKKILYHGTLANHIRETNLEIYELCISTVEKATHNSGKDDITYFEFLYRADSQLRAIYWKGRKFESLPSFGRDMLEVLWSGNESQYKLYDSFLSEKVVSTYVSVRDPENDELMKAICGIEALWEISKKENHDLRYVYYLLAYHLSNQLILRVDEEEIRTIGELADLLRRKLDQSVKSMIEVTHKLIGYDEKLDVQLEAWLTMLGKKPEIDTWREFIQKSGEQV